MSVPIHDLEDFIRANLPLKAVATVPEIRLHTAAPTSRLSLLDSDVQPYWAYPWGGGAALAAEFGALSCDHLEHLGASGIAAKAASGTVAVLLLLTFSLNLVAIFVRANMRKKLRAMN